MGFGRAVSVLGVVAVLGLVAGSAAATTALSAWGKAVEVPGTAALNVGSSLNPAEAQVTAVACSSADNCAAGGYYTLASGNTQAFVVDEKNGVWGKATAVPGTAALGVASEVNSVSCASNGNCAAAGDYADSGGYGQAFVVDEHNGVWGNAVEVPGTATLNVDGQAAAFSVSCATASNCAAGGFYRDGSGHYQAFIASEANGVWGTAVEVPGTAALNSGTLFAAAASVSCPAAGDCVAGGQYTDGSGHLQAFVVRETNGVWGTAVEVPGTAALNTGGDAGVYSVSCAAAGECAAGGEYKDGSGHYQAFVVREASGVWGNAVEVPGTAALNSGGDGGMNSVSCGAAGDCAAGGRYKDGAGHYQAFVARETNGVWGAAVKAPGTAALNSGGAGWVNSVSCGAAGYCAAGGQYTDGSGHLQAFVVNETNGVWGTAVQVPGTSTLNSGGNAWVRSISCAAAGVCSAGGTYEDGSGHQQAFVVNETARLAAGTTTCNGAYGGTGLSVVVPAAATCTLVPGAYVKTTVTVRPGGTLNVNGVTIGGKLTVSGSATVCGSKIGTGVVATGGSFALGGPGCAGNKILTGNVLVKNDPNGVWVWGNTVKMGGLTVKYGTGATDSIVGNTVSGNLLVEYSGPPVEVRGNHAATARCVSNKGQTGYGNKTKGTNTCPH
jgi:hypothetical protein